MVENSQHKFLQSKSSSFEWVNFKQKIPKCKQREGAVGEDNFSSVDHPPYWPKNVQISKYNKENIFSDTANHFLSKGV